MAVSSDIAEDDRDLPRLRNEQVVEAPAGGWPLGGPVGHGSRQPAELGGNLGYERHLHDAQFPEQRDTLTLQAPRAKRRQARANTEPNRQEQQRRDNRLAPVGNRNRQGYMPTDRVQGIIRGARRCTRTRG